jgi:hypothetical protein
MVVKSLNKNSLADRPLRDLLVLQDNRFPKREVRAQCRNYSKQARRRPRRSRRTYNIGQPSNNIAHQREECSKT